MEGVTSGRDRQRVLCPAAGMPGGQAADELALVSWNANRSPWASSPRRTRHGT